MEVVVVVVVVVWITLPNLIIMMPKDDTNRYRWILVLDDFYSSGWFRRDRWMNRNRLCNCCGVAKEVQPRTPLYLCAITIYIWTQIWSIINEASIFFGNSYKYWWFVVFREMSYSSIWLLNKSSIESTG